MNPCHPLNLRLRTSLLIAFLLLAGCAEQQQAVFAPGSPARLSEWSLFSVDGGQLSPSENVVSYTLNSTLFTDYAHKLRTLTLPEGSAATIAEDGAVEFPVGTIISKTFFYPLGSAEGGAFVKVQDQGQYIDERGALDLAAVRLIETRLLVHRDSGWVALPYVWNEAQTDASLEVTGDLQNVSLAVDEDVIEFPYIVPDQNQCAGCHETDTQAKGLLPIGPKLTNLNRPGHSGQNQLSMFKQLGWLPATMNADTAPLLTNWADVTAPLEDRARAYLEVNCGHCHSPVGPADTSGLYLDAATDNPVRLGRCKLPIAAGQGTGGNKYSIVPGNADQSILTYRMAATDPGAMMPELGRSLVHTEGVELVSEWINAMQGSCGG